MLYGTYPTNTYYEFQPLRPYGTPSFENNVGDLYGQYIKQSALVPNGGTEMNFFPVRGDHDWHDETIQIDEATGYSIGPASLGYNVTVNISTDPTFYTNAQTYLAGSNTNPSNTQFGLTTVYDKVTIFGAPDTPENGDTYETYFSGLYGLPTSQTASTAPVRWYDTLQGNVHVFALSTDPNELFQSGLKSIDIQDSGTSADIFANTPQGQWFTAALNPSTATWNIVETHQPIVSARLGDRVRGQRQEGRGRKKDSRNHNRYSRLSHRHLHSALSGLHRPTPNQRHWTFMNGEVPEQYLNAQNDVGYTTSAIAEGGALYEKNCLKCHGERGLGDGEAAGDLTPSPALLAYLVATADHRRSVFAVEHLRGRQRFRHGHAGVEGHAERRPDLEDHRLSARGLPGCGSRGQRR
jgi:mono/diheme cytochrome c family protein